jgi:hypothetical protein
MEVHHWPSEVIGRQTFYQAFVALGHKPPDPPMDEFTFDRMLHKFSGN